ncbi:hypothetical protein IWX90DRAFT_132379 [Phyllosticta citrichinensis]|uniref:Secreted protein n=1 Tax=Phyllosticta citrichinensis TaxID=1130410 RepID=A0ABR1Y4Y5_9PEZI
MRCRLCLSPLAFIWAAPPASGSPDRCQYWGQVDCLRLGKKCKVGLMQRERSLAVSMHTSPIREYHDNWTKPRWLV